MADKAFILRETLSVLSRKYPIGLYEYLFKHKEKLYRQLLDLEEEIDSVFLSGTIHELKSVLREYWIFHINVIKEFQKVEQLDLNLAEVRKKMAEERIRA
jgi:hypothetical protein